MVRKTISELKITGSSPMRQYCDKKAAVSIAHNHVDQNHTTHVEVDCHFIKEKIIMEACMTYLPTKEQTAEILTKSLHKPSFKDLISKLGMIYIYIPT